MTKANGFGAGRVRTPRSQDDNQAEENKVAPATPQRRTRRAAQGSRARSSRAAEQRSEAQAHPGSDAPWKQPTSLEAPEARPGYKQRWVRVSTFGKEDVQNVARKFREGWLPRPANTVPRSLHVPTIRSGQYAGCIGVEGSILCEMPIAKAKQRNAHYRGLAEKMAKDVERNVNSVNSRIPNHSGFGKIHRSETTKMVREAPVDSGDEVVA